ncbi:unnamed protein product, partial [Durusdinium trenchii]
SGTRFLPLQEALPNSRFAMESTTTTAPDVTKPTEEPTPAEAEATAPAATPIPAPARPSVSEQQERIQQVIEVTKASVQAAVQALQTFDWDVPRAVEKILSAHEATKQVLSQRNPSNPPVKSTIPVAAAPIIPVAQPVIHQLYAGHQSQALSIPGETDAIEGWLLAFLKGFAQGCLGGCAVGICSAFI